MLLRFGKQGVNMAQVTSWDWFPASRGEPACYKLWHAYDIGIGDGAACTILEGAAAEAFELWLEKNSTDIIASMMDEA
jgi:hypothetical protein